MKKHTLCFLLLLCLLSLDSHAKWQWAIAAGDTGTENIVSVGNYINGEIIIAGNFSSPSINLGQGPLMNNGGNDFFVAKFDTVGNCIWSKSYGGSGDDFVNSMVVSPSCGIIVTGKFGSASMDFGLGQVSNYNPTTTDAFIMNLEYYMGATKWISPIYGDGDDSGNDVTSLGYNGYITVTGSFSSSTLYCGPDSLPLSGFGPNTFIIQMDSLGPAFYTYWMHSISGLSTGYCISEDQSENIYLAGDFSDTILYVGTDTLVNPDASQTPELYLIKYDRNGNQTWVRSFGGDDYDVVSDIDVDFNGNIYATGFFFSHSIIFDSIVLPLTNVGGDDYYIAKFDTLGNVIWARGVNGGYCEGSAVKSANSSELYVAGIFSESVSFGNFHLQSDTSTGLQSDAFLTKYDSSGNVIWADQITGDGYETIESISTFQNALYVGGHFTGSACVLDTIVLNKSGSVSLISDLFVARHSPQCTSFFTVQPDTTPQTWLIYNYATGSGPLNYSWDWGDGSTSSGITPTHTYAAAGMYYICLTISDSTGCQDTYCLNSYVFRVSEEHLMIYIIVVDPLMTTVDEIQNQISVFPSPTTNYILIRGNNGQYNFQVTDLSGKNLMNGILPDGGKEINVSGLAKGVYLLELENGGKKFVKRIMKM